MLKGGYQIVDLKNIELSEQGYLFSGLYNQLLNNHDKVVMLSNINIEDITFKDYFVQPIVTENGIECTIGDKTITVTPLDVVSVADGIIGGGGGSDPVDTFSLGFVTSLNNYSGFLQGMQGVLSNQGYGSSYTLSTSDTEKIVLDDRFESKFPAPTQAGYSATYYTNFWIKIYASNAKTIIVSLTLPVIITRTKTRTRINAGAAMDVNAGSSTPLQRMGYIVGYPYMFYDNNNGSVSLTFGMNNLEWLNDLYPTAIEGTYIELTGDGETAPNLPTTAGSVVNYNTSMFNNVSYNHGTIRGGGSSGDLYIHDLIDDGEIDVATVFQNNSYREDGESSGDFDMIDSTYFASAVLYRSGHLYNVSGEINRTMHYVGGSYTTTEYNISISIRCLS